VAPFLIASALSASSASAWCAYSVRSARCKYKPNPTAAQGQPAADQIKFFYRPTEASPVAAERRTRGRGERGAGGGRARLSAVRRTGYRGRTGIFEMLVVSDRIRDLIRENPNLNAIKQEALRPA